MVTEQQRPTEEEIRERLLAFSKRLLASKKQTQKEMREAYQNDPVMKDTIAKLKKNAERETTTTSL